MAFRYNNEDYLFVNDNDGTIRSTSESHKPKDKSTIISMEEALKKIYCIKNYREFIRALEKEDSFNSFITFNLFSATSVKVLPFLYIK